MEVKILKKNKLILSNCPNFYRIVNFDYFEDDYVTDKLIKIYEEYIFNIDVTNYDELRIVKQIDYVLGKYLDDYLFRKKMKIEILKVKVNKSSSNIRKTIVESIINIFKRYKEEVTREIYISRWI